MKNLSDFIGSHLAQSEENTNAILDASTGCVLVIDEAYGLHVKAGSGSGDPYEVAVINTIVAKVQGVPGDDRCVLLLGYPDQMGEMLREANPGLARRFQTENAFVFVDYGDDDLIRILRAQAEEKGWTVPIDASIAAIDVGQTASKTRTRLRVRLWQGALH